MRNAQQQRTQKNQRPLRRDWGEPSSPHLLFGRFVAGGVEELEREVDGIVEAL